MSLLLALSQAHAEPFQLDAGATFGRGPDAEFVMRGSLIYGVAPRLNVIAESGVHPGFDALTLTFGPSVLPVETRWWTVGIAALPELVVPLGYEPVRGYPTALGPLTFELRSSAQVSWLAFWGLSFTGRVDRVSPFDGEPGWTEWGVGLSGRL